jgi:hypothetical protein
MIRLTLFVPLLLFFNTCLAQFNDTTSYVFHYNTGGSLNQTDDNKAYLLNNAFRFGIKKKTISLNFSNNWVYGKQDRKLTNNDFSSALDFNLYRTFPHFFYWGLVNYNTSRSLKINNQLLAGAGIAYSIYDRPEAYLNISNGLLFDSSDLILDSGINDVYQTYRNSLRISFNFVIKKIIVLNNSSYLQSSLTDGNDYNIKSVSSLSFKVNKWLSLTTTYNYNRVNRTDRENSLLSYGLTFERYF